MKKLLVAIMTITVALVGVLHASYVQHKTLEDIAVIEQYLSQYPEEMPDITLQPMAGFSLNW